MWNTYDANYNLLNKLLFHHMTVRECHKALLHVFLFCLQSEQMLLWERFARSSFSLMPTFQNVQNWHFFFILIFAGGDKVSLCITGCSQTYKDPPASASSMLRLQVYKYPTQTLCPYWYILLQTGYIPLLDLWMSTYTFCIF